MQLETDQDIFKMQPVPLDLNQGFVSRVWGVVLQTDFGGRPDVVFAFVSDREAVSDNVVTDLWDGGFEGSQEQLRTPRLRCSRIKRE